MSDSSAELILWVLTAATTFYAYLAWRLRPFWRNPEGRPGGFTGTLAMGIAMYHQALGQKLYLSGGTLPRWTSLTFLAAVLVAYHCVFWIHVEDLRAKWRDRPDSPDPALFPTFRWKWAAALATIITVISLYASIAWEVQHAGSLAVWAALVAIYAWGDWVWRRWELSMIRRIQARHPSLEIAGSPVSNATTQ